MVSAGSGRIRIEEVTRGDRGHGSAPGNHDGAEAARAAGELEIKQTAQQLIELLDDADNKVRSASIWALSQIGGEGVRQSLERLLEQAEDYEDIDLLEAALDNLAFTEDIELFPI